MNKGFKKVETTISKYNNEDNIYNKYFKNETFDFFWFCAFSFLTSLGIYYIVQCVKRKKHILAKISVSR